MGSEHAKTLRSARDRMVQDRRRLAETLAKPYDREQTPGARENIVKVQQAIDAIDAAIADEDKPTPADIGDFLKKDDPNIG